jgi:hypothetical protein
MGKMTRAQADKLLVKEVGEPSDGAWDRIGKTAPKVKKLATQLEAEITKAESREMVDALAKTMKLHLRSLAEDVAILAAGLKRLGELTDDEDFLQAIGPDELAAGMKEATERIESGRNAVRDAKTAFDKSQEFLKNQRVDPDAAGEDWATAVTNVDRVVSGALKEAPAWSTLLKDAQAARDARDKAKLASLRKTKPESANLDAVLKLDEKNPFAAFDKDYDVADLPESLRKEIAADRGKQVPLFAKARLLALEKKAIAAEVDGFTIEARDGDKALKTLGFPKSALPKLQAAIDGPDAAMPKALEQLAKTCKLELGSGRDMVAALKKAGVL